MGNCKINLPRIPQAQTKHKKLFVIHTCNNIVLADEKYDATKGELHLNLNCIENDKLEGDWINPPGEADNNQYDMKLNNIENQLNILNDGIENLNNIIINI